MTDALDTKEKLAMEENLDMDEQRALEAEGAAPPAKPAADPLDKPLPPLGRLVTRGSRLVGDHWRLFAALYLVQLTAAVLFTWIASTSLGAVFANRPAFDQAVDGDLASLVFVLADEPQVFLALAWMGIGTVLGYSLVSWYLIGGVNAVLVRAEPGVQEKKGEVVARFGAGGARTYFAYARLFLLSLIPYALLGALLLYGLDRAAADLAYGLSLGDVLGATVPKLLPALLVYLVHQTALDYARVELARTIGLASRHALWRGYKMIFRDWRPLTHVLLYLLVFTAITTLYLIGTVGQPMAGTMGAVALFFLRQLVSMARYGAEMVCAAGQVVYARSLARDRGAKKRLPVLG